MARKCGHCREEGHTQRTCPVKNQPRATCPEDGCGAEMAATALDSHVAGAHGEPAENGSETEIPYVETEPEPGTCTRCGEPRDGHAHDEEPDSCIHADGFVVRDGTSCCVTCGHPDTAAAKLERYRAKHHAPDCDSPCCVPTADPMLEQLRDSGLVESPAPVSVPAPTVPVMETTTEPDPFSDPTPRNGIPLPPIEFSDPTPVKPKRQQTNRRGYLAKDPVLGGYRRFQNGNIKPITRVSTFIKAGSDRTALTDWNMRNVLLGAVHFPQIAAQAKVLHPNPDGPLPEDKDTKQALDRIVDQVAERVGSKRAANRGTAVHDSIEKVAKGQATLDQIPKDHVPWVKAYLAALDANGLEIMPDLVEGTIFVPQFGGVMGRFDQCVRERATGRVLMADVKTGELDYAWGEIQGQLAMYVCGYAQHGTYVWDETDPELDHWVPPAYTLDADEGIVFHLPVKHGDVRCDLKRVDLRAGWEHVKLCAQNREAASSRPKAQPWVPASVPAPAPVPEPAYCGVCMYGSDVGVPGYDDKGPAYVNPSCPTHGSPESEPRNWRGEFEWAQSREHMAALYEQAAAAGVPGPELNRLVAIGSMRLMALANGAPLYPASTPDPPF